MKRKAPVAADALEVVQQSGRRQPQTSCLNCRVKKIKCDRGAPCASCVIRGISCMGQPGSKPAVVPHHNVADSGIDTSILSRLASLERAVFGDARPTSDMVNGNGPSLGTKSLLQSSPASSTEFATVNTSSPLSHQDTERQQAAKFLDFTHTRDEHSISAQANRTRFHVAPASSHQRLAGKHPSCAEPPSRSVFMMTREEALLLLRDFCENPYHLLPIIYEPSARSLINTFYTQLESGHEGDPTAAALILSIASTSASFFHHRSTHEIFASIEEADQASVAWRQTALAILDDSQFSTQGSLERCQARAIIAYVVSNVEGCSVRYRLLHSYSMAIARDMSLHLIDSPMMTDKSDDLPTREIKRRLWWHLASTDWLLSLVGGPLDGTYTVQPRHFIVNRPRNINDSDLNQSDTLTYPSHVLTQVSCYLQRIRLSEICREMADARAPGLLGVDITDFNTVSSLDRLFEQALAEMPPSLRQDAPIPEDAPLHHAQQRDLTLLCFNFRRARLHRPFLLHDTDNPLHEASRRQCLTSARIVLSISIKMLEGPSAVCPDQDLGHPLAYRAGLVISAMFTACTILALNAGLIWSRTKGDARTGDASEMHGEITGACRVLAKAGEKSGFAANLVRNLVGVLKQYSVKDIDCLVVPSGHPDLNSKYVAGNNDNAFPTHTPRDRLQSMSDPANLVDDFSMWNGFFTTIPEMEEHDQLFAGLDYYCGPT